MKIEKALSNFVLVRKIQEDEKNKIVLPEQVRQGLAIQFAEVLIPHEPFKAQDGSMADCPVKIGDKVMYISMLAAAIPVKHDGKEAFLVPANAIAAVVSDFEEKKNSNISLLH